MDIRFYEILGGNMNGLTLLVVIPFIMIVWTLEEVLKNRGN